MINEAKRAYEDGVKDGENGRQKKNASDFWAWHAHDYEMGYEEGKAKLKESEEK